MRRNLIGGVFVGCAVLSSGGAEAQDVSRQRTTVSIVRAPNAPIPDTPEQLVAAMSQPAYGAAREVVAVPPTAELTRCAGRSTHARRAACVRALPREAVTIVVERGRSNATVLRCIGFGRRESAPAAQAFELYHLSWPPPGGADTDSFRANRGHLTACLDAAGREPR